MTAESVLFQVLLAAGVLPLALLLRRRGARAAGLGALALWAGAAGWAASGRAPVGRARPAPDDRPLAVEGEGYVSSDACRACHPEQYGSWHDSYHRRMTQVASPEAIVAAFDGREVSFDGLRYRPERVGDAFWFEMPDFDRPRSPARVRAEVVLVTGSHHEQDFWVSAGAGRGVRRVPIVWRIEEARWLPNEAVFLRPPLARHGEETMPPNEWNVSCIKCHATRGRPGFAPGSDAWADTVVAELGIACEACHGAGREHVEANRSPLARYGQHLGEPAESALVDPAALTPARSAEVCGQCHSVSGLDGADAMRAWAAHGSTFAPGEELETGGRYVVRADEAARRPALAHQLERDPSFLADRFWDDGTVRVSGREYNALVASPCFRDGSRAGDMSCLSCHRLHQADDDPRAPAEWADDQLAAGMDGDGACLQCHAVGPEHAHHAAGTPGGRCYDCHMPYTTLGLLKAIRSHRVESPSVADSLRSRRPDACGLCHLDRSRAWVAERLTEWYGAPPVAADDPHADAPLALVLALSGDAGQRDLAAWHLGWEGARAALGGGDWVAPLLIELLDDPYAAVRFNAGRSLERWPGFEGLGYDFVAERSERRAAQERARGILRAAGRAGELAGLLPGGDAATIDALRRARDERAVYLRE